MGLHLFKQDMEIGVFEFADPGHFTLLDSVARIFSSSEKNRVVLHTSQNHQSKCTQLIQKLQRLNLTIDSIESPSNIQLAVIITPDHQLDKTFQIVSDYPTWMFIHNIDDWFDLTLSKTLRQTSSALIKDKNPRLAYYLFKRAIKGNRIKKQIIQQQLATENAHFLVLNEDLKTELSSFVPVAKIKIIPFSVYDPELKDMSHQNERVRICIPGILSQKRRDYLSLFKVLESMPMSLLEKIEIDLLGGISPTAGEQSDIVVKNAKRLIKNNYPIILREKAYIELDEFDIELSKADIILGNLNIDQGGGSRYGKTKESGIPFTMIRAAKPGIMPAEYSVLQELRTSTQTFKDYSELKSIFDELTNLELLNKLKEEAKINSQKFIDRVILNKP